jgi:hypothetical protein
MPVTLFPLTPPPTIAIGEMPGLRWSWISSHKASWELPHVTWLSLAQQEHQVFGLVLPLICTTHIWKSPVIHWIMIAQRKAGNKVST